MTQSHRTGAASRDARRIPAPPTAFGPGQPATQPAIQARRAAQQPPPQTRYQPAPPAVQAKSVAPPKGRAPGGNRAASAQHGTVQRMNAPFDTATNEVVALWDDYKSRKNKGDSDLKTRIISGVVLRDDTVVLGTSGWDSREEHSDSVDVFRPALEVGHHKDFGISCGEKDAMLKLYEGAFHDNYRNIKDEHERCSGNYFRILREKLRDEYGTIKGTVSVVGKVNRTDLTYIQCCDGCLKMLLKRSTRLYSVPDMVRIEHKGGKKLF